VTREIHNESRYHFHLYAFILTVFALAVGTVARLAVEALDAAAALRGRRFAAPRIVEGAVVLLLVLLLSPDVAPGALGRFVDRGYATPKDPVRAILNWQPYATFHQDHGGPAAVVRAGLRPGDRVLVVGPTYWASIYAHYVGQVDYVVSEKAERLGRDGRVLHHVTGVRCLTSPDELDQVLAADRGRRLWILGDLHLLGDGSPYFSAAMKERLRPLAARIVHLGRDVDTFAARRDPAAGGGTP
jgi:hypothetical protein